MGRRTRRTFRDALKEAGMDTQKAARIVLENMTEVAGLLGRVGLQNSESRYVAEHAFRVYYR